MQTTTVYTTAQYTCKYIIVTADTDTKEFAAAVMNQYNVNVYNVTRKTIKGLLSNVASKFGIGVCDINETSLTVADVADAVEQIRAAQRAQRIEAKRKFIEFLDCNGIKHVGAMEYNEELERFYGCNGEFVSMVREMRETVCSVIGGEKFEDADVDSLFMHANIKYMGVNWAAMGTKTPEEAEAYGLKLIQAAAVAKSFKYNGYYVE